MQKLNIIENPEGKDFKFTIQGWSEFNIWSEPLSDRKFILSNIFNSLGINRLPYLTNIFINSTGHYATSELEFCTIVEIPFPVFYNFTGEELIFIRSENSEIRTIHQVPIKYLSAVEIRPNSVPQSNEPRIITIGSDIEFAFIKDEKMVNWHDAISENFRESGEVGTDHGGAVGEFRPSASESPIEHCKNLKKAIRHIIEGGFMFEDTFLDSSHIVGDRPLGGHIHFGVKNPREIEMCRKNLDYWLMPTIQPLFPKEVFMARMKTSYGKMSSGEPARIQPHGFEYRVPPSFIFDEGIAKGIFCLAWVIVKLTVEGKLKVRVNEKSSQWVQNFFKNYEEYGLNELNDVREESIRKLLNKNLLGDLDKYINPLFDAIKYRAEFSGDIAEGWGLEYEYVQHSRNQTNGRVDRVAEAFIRLRDPLRFRGGITFGD